MTSIFNASWEYPTMHVCANLVILAQIFDVLSRAQAEFRRILSQNDQNNLEGQGHFELHFQYQPRLSQDACLVQIW